MHALCTLLINIGSLENISVSQMRIELIAVVLCTRYAYAVSCFEVTFVATFLISLLYKVTTKLAKFHTCTAHSSQSHRPALTWIQFKYSRYLFLCQGISTKRQRRNLFGLRVKLLPATTSLTPQSVKSLSKDTTSELAALSLH